MGPQAPWAFHEIYVQVQSNQISAKDLDTGRIGVIKFNPIGNWNTHEFESILNCLVKTIRNGSSFSLLKKRVILHWQIDWPIEAKTIGPMLFRDCDAKDLLICTYKDGSLEEILKVVPWRLKK